MVVKLKRLSTLFTFLFLFTSAQLFAQQVVLTDDFEDEDLSQSPVWTGDLNDFTFFDDAGNTLLRLDAGEEGNTVISTPSSVAYGSWEFFIEQDFSPSNSNRGFVFLMSDISDLNGDVNGYAIRTGANGSDDKFRLFRFTNGSETEILEGSVDLSGGGRFQIRVERDDDGEWRLFESAGYGTTPVLSGTVNDNTHITSNYFGLNLDYTVTRANLYYFDDFVIENSEPFDVVSASVNSATELEISFNYPLDFTSVDASDFNMDNGVGIPLSADAGSDNFSVLLTFANTLEENDYSLQINDVENIFGGVIPANTEIDFTVSNPFDVVSVEPITASRIAVEFTEEPDETSWNASDFEISPDAGGGPITPLSLDYDGSGSPNTLFLVLNDPLPLGDYTLNIENNGNSINGWPIAGDTSFNFTLENPFFVTNFEILSRSEFEITFSQDVQTVNAGNFVITGFGSPDNIQQPATDIVRLNYSSPVEVGERELIINDVVSNQDWEIEANTTLEFSLFDEFEAGDLAISEFYYRVPIAWRTATFDRPQYVEIFNRSNKLLNLRDFTISGFNISESSDLPIGSGEFLVIARGVPVFEEQFGDRNFVEADNFPTLNLTTSSTIEFATDDGTTIEALTYDAGLWGGNEVSLERFDFDVSAEFRDNWAESEDILSGSPGLSNTVTAPTNSPEAVAAAFTAPRLLEITFSRTLSAASRQNLGAYSLDNGASLTAVNETDDPRTLEFELADRLEDQFEYTFSFQNIEDIFGNQVSGTDNFNFVFENPFRILAAEVENGTDLLVQFTLPLTTGSVNLSDFELGDGTSPVSFQFDDSETVRLTFSDPFQNGSFEVVVNDIQSFVPGLPEQWLIEENSTAEFFRFDEYQPGDIVINEFMYRPPSGYPKYVEVKNISNRFLTLKDFELRREAGASSNGGTISEFDIPIEPGGFVVITENSSLLEDLFGAGPWFEMADFPGFTLTTPDQIRFIDADGDLTEAVDYDPATWGGDGVSLERKSTEAPANDINNWGQSLDELFGTPGDENTVEPDDGPQLLSANFVDSETVRLSFTGSLDFSAISASNFSINRNVSVDNIQVVNGSSIDLILNRAMNSGTTYTVTVNNIADIFGNELSGAQASFTYYLVEEAGPGDVLISEFMYNEPDGYSEYIELYNSSNKVFDLSGWQQANDTGSRNVITDESIFLTPGSYIVILRNLNILDFFSDIPYINAGSSLSALKNGGDEIVITNENNVTLDSLRYNPGWGGSGVSLERRDLDATATDQNNWAESLSPLLGTPGSANSVDVDQEAPELIATDFVNERTVRVVVTGAVDRDRTSPSNFSINGGRSVSSIDYTPDGNILLNLDGRMTSGREYTVSVRNLRDIFDNVLSSAQSSFVYYDIEQAAPGDVVINEFMYDEPEDYTRYIELYNRSDKAVNLAGWQQANDTGTRRVLTTERVILPPNSYIVLLPNFNLLSVFPDIPALNAGSGLSALKNGGDNIVIANAENVVLDSLTYVPEWGGEGVSLERRRADRSPLFAENWADSPSEKFGTPGRANEVERSFELIVTDIEALSPTEVQVTFNTDIRQNSAARGNFISDGVRPESVSLLEGRIALLQFGSPLPTGPRTLSIDNVQTLGGFSIAENTEINFTVYDLFEPGDVLVNEFMYRPPADYPRYVELINRTEKLLNLKNWRLQRRQTTGESFRFLSESDLTLEPGEFLVVTDDLSLFEETYGDRNTVEMDAFPGFTLTVEDQIRLFTGSGFLADSLAYNPATWGGDGVALERISLDVSSILRANWAESSNLNFGTPGQPNEVQPDTDPPQIVRAAQFEDLGFRLVFDEQLDSETAMDVSNYSIEPPLGLSMIGLDNNEVILFADGELQNDQVYEIYVSGVTDIFGNEMEPVSLSIRYLDFGEAAPGDIVINEILYRRLRAGSPEFIEVYNTTDKNIDLSGWILSDDSGDATVPNGVAIRENDFLVFTDSESLANGSEKIIQMPNFPSLNDNGDAAILKTPSSVVIDSLFYQADWAPINVGISLERKDPFALSIDPVNWAASRDESGSTPASENSRFARDTEGPEIIFANSFHPDSVEVLFNEFINLAPDEDPTAGTISSFRKQSDSFENSRTRFLINGTQADILKYDPQQGNRVVISGASVSSGEEVSLTVEQAGDFQGNESSTLSLEISQPLAPGDLVINEIMFDPISDDRDGLPDQSDYVEIHNPNSFAISLEGIFLHDEPDENGEITRLDPLSTRARWIPAGGYALFYPEPERQPFEESRTAVFFNIPAEFSSFALQTERTTMSLPISGRQIYLADSTQTTIDMVDYREEWHNPNIIDTKGIALERINPNYESNDPVNWGSNASSVGGSPGSENSIFQTTDPLMADTGVDLSPNPFSPDGDGFDDALLINYKLDEPDYLLKIRIFDRYGRLVRKLAEARPAGFDGSIIWDGMTDSGQTNRIGIYIVLIEAYNSSNGSNRTFKETAVIARQF
jgi:hypothetical protein